MFFKHKAFSFLELLIVMAVLTLIFSLTIFGFQKLSYVSQQKIFFNQLLADVDQIRDLSRLDHQDRQIDFFADHYEIKILSQTVKSKPYPQFLSLKKGVSFSFSNLGIPKKSGTVVFVDQKGKIFQVILAPVTGRIRWEGL